MVVDEARSSGARRVSAQSRVLAIMFGVRRQSVTVVAGTLQEAGLISYKHGHVKILDRKGLEAASCECYGILRRRFDGTSQLADSPVSDPTPMGVG